VHIARGKEICFEVPGRVWDSKYATTTLGHVLLHVARLINFDDANYVGWNGDAVKYWRGSLKPGRSLQS